MGADSSQPMSMNMSSKCQSTLNYMATTHTCTRTRTRTRFANYSLRASQSMDDLDKFSKHLGMFPLRKKIEDIVLRAEMLGPSALQLEEDKRIKREEQIRDYDLWDDPVKSSELFAEFADSTEVVDAFKDLRYKIEEAKLIKELTEIDAVNYRLFKQAYMASVDVNSFLDSYQMSKLFRGSYDMHGASVVIKSGDRDIYSELWAERLLNMYIDWAQKKGHKGRVLLKNSFKGGGIKSATIEFEFKFAYGYLMGERGVHRMMGSVNGSSLEKASLASVDVTPLFLNMVPKLALDDKDLIISYMSSSESEKEVKQPIPSHVHIQHFPTGINVQSSGERNRFMNKAKTLNRLKAKLLVIMSEQGISDVSSIDRDAIVDLWKQDTRRYLLHPYKVVEDMETGVQLADLDSVLNGNIDPLIVAHVNLRHGGYKV